MTYIAHTQQPVDAQSLAQAELAHYMNEQAQAIAPESLTTVEINPNHFEVYAGKWLVAYITYDYSDFITQPWVVMVSGEEKFRHNTQVQCFRFINWHYKDGTLNPQPQAEVPEVPFISEISFYDQEALVGGELVASVSYSHDDQQNSYWQVIINNEKIFTDSTPARCHSYVKQQYQAELLPVQEPFEQPCTTGNEIMVQIAQACENFGLELLDDGIYRGDEKLGEVGQTNGNWWFTRTSDAHQQRILCDSASDAVWWLSKEDLPECTPLDEYLQYRPLEQMPAVELKELLDSAEFVAA
ncbi:hypothetical protein H6G94_31170 [Nostoc punctiforme FACHB-252]|uniref:Uncharacterized protein n=1 Tax=Nostoc punctiforme FACHB-252 TaxID=1357509 RepID=A0ABR8HJC0_NOSPU|nr:hypothetical protein [Nostoc punctiforme]MBD2615662.1 hypothetical protein [Nostoc punctiforme FACHB-252]